MLFLQKKIFPTLIKVGKWAAKRKYRIGIAVIAFVFISAFFLRPGGPMRAEQSDYLTGEGSFPLTAERERGFCQEFTPQYALLDSVGISFDKGGVESADCTIYVSVKDVRDDLLFERRLDFAEINDHVYTDIEMGIRLKKGALYYLCIDFDNRDGAAAGVNVCGKEYELKENQDFFQGDEKLDVQLVTMYSYSDALTWESSRIVYLLCFLAALGIAIGTPGHKSWNFALGAGIFLLAPPFLGYYLEMLTTDMEQLTQTNLQINIGLIYIWWLILLFMTLSWRIAITAGTISVSALYIVNYYFTRFRGAPFKLGEVRAWRTAAKVAGNYDYSFDKKLAVVFLLVILIVIWAGQVKGLKVKALWRVCGCMAGAAGLLTSVYLFDQGNILENAGIFYSGGFDQQAVYRINGYLASTVLDLKNTKIKNRMDMEKKRLKKY